MHEFLLSSSSNAPVSIFSGDTLDMVANAIAWGVLVIVPAVAIIVFWLVHILPEKIAHKRKHPQTKAIQTLCLLSLFFGGLLWPLAWLWAYSKPVLYKMAYGTDVDESLGDDHAKDAASVSAPEDELQVLRRRVAELEASLGKSRAAGKS
jgi:CBS domain containing-hemolysin-like protein